MTRTMVGLDIGGSGVRAAEFDVGRRATLRRFAAVALPEGVIRAGLVVDPDALAEALKELWRQGRFSSKNVVVGIANDAVLVRQVDLEWMPPADFRKGLRYQVADALPVPVDEANLDYYMLDEIEQPAQGNEPARKIARVMLVAAGRDMVDGFVRAIQAAGLRATCVDLLPFALVRALGPVGDPASPLEVVVDIGADTVVVVVHQGGRPRFVRTLAGLGGQTITRALMERYEWTWEDAERTKIVLGLPGHASSVPYAVQDGDPAPPLPSLDDHPAHAVIAEHVESLVAELGATVDYFRGSTTGDAQLARLVLTGKASALGGLAETVERELGLPVVPLSVLEQVHKPRRILLLEEQVAELVVPAGLCLRPAS
ncbi:MAG TPA: type IV pilus assembly protein PilM [Nocardioidaceae bacterium]|nr:type IV pilus assembly protein PilM [Nocardioidaceae bacterium]